MKKVKTITEHFLNAWSENDTRTMHQLCQKTYKVGHNEKQLGALFPETLSSFKIGKATKITEVVYDVDVSLTISGKKRSAKVRLLCEIQPWRASIKGQWGVNPLSLNRV